MLEKKMIALQINYLGSNFCGMQQQAKSRTIANELETAISSIVCHKIKLLFAGRTDAGVHATHQVVSFLTTASRPMQAYIEGVNKALPKDIRVNLAFEIPDNFHPRFDAISREYIYLFYKDKFLPSQWIGRAGAISCKINPCLIEEAAKFLIGEHDFTSFRAHGCQSISPKRNIHNLQIFDLGVWLIIKIEANAYLYRMVRKITKALMAVGSGLWTIKDFLEKFHLKDPSIIAPLAPDGLYLTNIKYPEKYDIINKKIPCWLEQMIGMKTENDIA